MMEFFMGGFCLMAGFILGAAIVALGQQTKEREEKWNQKDN